MVQSKIEDYNWAVSSVRLNMTLFGLWKNPNSLLSTKLFGVPTIMINLYLIICAIIPQSWALYRLRRRFDVVSGNLMVTFTFGVCVFKMFLLLKKKEVLYNFFLAIKEDWESEMKAEEREILAKNWRISHKIHLYAFIQALILPFSFHCTVPFNFVVRPITNLTDVIGGRYHVYSSIYPFETQSSPRFELIAFNEAMEGTFVCLTIIMADVLYCTFVFHVCGQLEILASRIQALAECEKKNITRQLENYVEHHLRIIKLARIVDDLFNEIILAVFTHFLLAFCSQAFTALTTPTKSTEKAEMILRTAFFVSYTIYLLFLNFLYCWAGEALMEKSLEVHSAVYNSNWMELPPKKAILLKLMQIRSQKALAVTIEKILPVTLETYAKLIKTCAGYLSMLITLSH